MSIPLSNNLDANNNQILNFRIQVLAAAPTPSGGGHAYYDSVLGSPHHRDGTTNTWVPWDARLRTGIPIANLATDPLARANHTGTQLANTISNFDTQVRTNRLDQMASPTAAVSFGSQLLTNVADPVSATDGANKRYVDGVIQGVKHKPTADVSTAAALASVTYANGTAGVGATLTATANGALSVDGYAPTAGQIVLVRHQASTFQNGLYVVTNAGSGGTPFVLTRHVEMDQATEFSGGLVAVENNGSTTGNTLWLCNVADSITVGTTAVTFTQINGATTLVAGNGINISGNTITAVVVASGGLTVGGSGLALDTAIAVRKFAATITGDGSTTQFTVTHNLNARDITLAMQDSSNVSWLPDWDTTSVNAARITFGIAPANAVTFRVTIHA